MSNTFLGLLLGLLLGLVLGWWLFQRVPDAPPADAPPPRETPTQPVEPDPLPATAAELPAEIHAKHFLYGYPLGAPATNDLLVRDGYALSSNDDTKFADWVAYRVTPGQIEGTSDTRRSWKPDPWLDDAETLEPADFKGAYAELGVDRGHQAPLATYSGTDVAEETNFLSNITPQRSPLNQGPWRILEERIRDFVEAEGTVYVFTGPFYERTMPSLPGADEPHRIPSGYWKVVATGPDDVQAAAFAFDQETPRDADLLDHVVSIDEVERRSGLDLLWALPDDVETPLERGVDRSFADAFVD